jgi:hypothetical protein
VAHGVHQDRLVLPCTLDETPLPQCLAGNVFLDVQKAGHEAAGRLARAIRDADGGPTPLAPLMRGESPELAEAIITIRNAQQEVGERLGAWELDRAAAAQAALDPVMDRARARWPLDPMIVNLDGYQLKNAFMVEHWDAIQAGRAPQDPVLERAERRFFETLSLDPTDPSALNGLGNVLFFSARPVRSGVLPPRRDRSGQEARDGGLSGGGARPRAGAALPARLGRSARTTGCPLTRPGRGC